MPAESHHPDVVDDALITRLASTGRLLVASDFDGVLLPGVKELLEALRGAGATMGLLTGNIAAGAQAKVGHFGLAEFFAFGAYGDDHHDRNRLGPIAVDRAERHCGRRFSASDTVVVGDTPKDIACGKSLGALTLCVATGNFGAEELRREGADVVVEDFTDAEAVFSELRGDSKVHR